MNSLKPHALVSSLSKNWFSLHLLFLTVLMATSFSLPGSVIAQPADPAKKAPVETVEEKPADEKPAEAEKQPVDHLIYIPYDRLNEVIDRLKSKVVLSYEEYLELVKKAGKRPTEMKPAAQAVISSSNYTAVVNGDVVEITAKYDCKAIQKSWAELPLNLGQTAIGEISTSGKRKVLLRGTGEGRYSLLFESAGHYEVTLKLLVQVKRSPAGPQVELMVPPVGITTMNFVVPKADQKIKISPRHIVIKDAKPTPKGSSQVSVSLGATQKISATWSPKTSDRPEMELLSKVTNEIKVSIRDGLIHTDAKLNYKVMRGEMNSLRVAVPVGHRILDVTSSSRMQGWTVKKEEKRQVIEIKLLGKVDKNLRLEVHTERALPKEAISLAGISPGGDLHGIHSLGVTRESGTLLVTHGKELTLVIDRQAGLVRTDTGNKSQSFKYFSPNFDFLVRVEPIKPILDVVHNATVIFREQRIDATSQMTYTIRRAGVFHLTMKLPEGFTLTGVQCPLMAEFQHDKKKQTLSIVLREQYQGVLNVTVGGYIAKPKEELKTETSELANLPLIEPIGVRQEEGRLAVFTIPAIELVADEDKIESAQAIPVNTISSRFSDATIRAAWKFQSRPVVIPVHTIRRPTRLTATTATTTRVEPAGAFVETYVNFHVQYAGIDRFYLAVPKAVSDQIQIEIAGAGNVPIQQKAPLVLNDDSKEAKADAGNSVDSHSEVDGTYNPDQWVIWMIKTQRPVTGYQQFKVTYDLPFQQADDDSEEGKAESVSAQNILLIQPLGGDEKAVSGPALSRATGEAVVHVDSALSLAVHATGQAVESIDIRELKLLAQQGQQAFRYPVQSASSPVLLTLNISRHEIESVVSTVVSRALTEFVLGASDKLAVRSRMRVKTSQRQRLMIQLPENVQPMLVLLNGETRELQKSEMKAEAGWTNYFVNVSRPGDSGQEFYITLQYLLPSSPLTNIMLRGGLKLSTPKLLTAEGANAVVQQSRAVVWMPEEYVPVTVKKPYQRYAQPEAASLSQGIQTDSDFLNNLQGWIKGNANAGFDFPTDGDVYMYESLGEPHQLELTIWAKTSLTVTLSLVLLVIGFILMRTSWENKFLVIITTITLLCVVMQYEPEMVKQGVYSARFGVFALLAIWVIHCLFSCCQHCFVKNTKPEEAEELVDLNHEQGDASDENGIDSEINTNIDEDKQADNERDGSE